MSTPLKYIPQPDDTPLGIDGAYHYFQRGGEVYYAAGPNCYLCGSYRCWSQQRVAQRIADQAAARTAKAAAAERARRGR